MLGFFATLACHDQSTDPKAGDLATQPWALRLGTRAIQMSVVAPYDTITLNAVVLNGLNEPIGIGEGATVTYVPVGDTSMRVNASGVLKVRRTTDPTGAKIVAQVTVGGVTVADTAIVVVDSTVTPVPLTLYRLRTSDGQPPILSRYENTDHPNPSFEVSVQGPSGDVVTTLTSSNATVAAFDASGTTYGAVTYAAAATSLFPIQEGTVTITASTTWYGKTLRDSLRVTVIGPLVANVLIFDRIPRDGTVPVPRFDPGTLTVAAGAIVGWNNWMSVGQPPVDIIFDDPTSAKAVTAELSASWNDLCTSVGVVERLGKSGNLAPLVPKLSFEQAGNDFQAFIANACRALDFRYFPTPGTYHYHTSAGTEGVIIVK